MIKLRLCNSLIIIGNRSVNSIAREVSSRSFADVNNTQTRFFRRAGNSHLFVVSTSSTREKLRSNSSPGPNVSIREKIVVSSRCNKNLVIGASQSGVKYGFINSSSVLLAASPRSKINGFTNVRHYSDAATPIVVPPSMELMGIWKTISESAPVEYSQNALIWFHTATGLPWWASLILATWTVRTLVTLPLALHQHYILAKVENLKYEMEDIVGKLKREANHNVALLECPENIARQVYQRSVRKEWQKLVERDNCHPMKAGVLILVQFPLWITLSTSIRNLCYMLPYQDETAHAIYLELTTGGFGWITNLTHGDHTLIIPVSLALLNLGIIEVQGAMRLKEPTKVQRYLTNFFRVFCVGMIPVAAYVPAGMSLFWTSSSAYGIIQNFILLSPKIRRLARIPETESEIDEPYKHFRDNMRRRICLKEVSLPKGVKKP